MSQKIPSFFTKYQWAEILAQTNPKKCHNYSEAFRAKAEEYQLYGDSLAQDIFTFLSKITCLSMALTGSNNTSFMEEMISERLSDDDLAILRELITTVSDPEMRARIADILWVCKRDTDRARPIKMARVAVQSYLQSAKTLEDVDEYTSCHDRIQRAAQLAPLIDGNKSKKMGCLVAQHIDNLIDRYADVENEFLTGSAMKVLQKELKKSLKAIYSDHLPGYAAKYAAVAAQKAVFADKLQDYYQQLAYRKIESKWHKIAGDQEAKRRAMWDIADAEVWYAQQAFIGKEPNSYAVAAGRLKSAIQAFRTIEDTFRKRQDTSERIQELHQIMLDYQQKSMSRMVSIPIDFDDTEMQQKARELVTGKSIRDALYSLAFRYSSLISNLDDLKEEAEQDTESYKLRDCIPTALIDEEGKTKAISGNGEDSIEHKMFRIANFYQGWYGLNLITPACKQICSEHDTRLDDLSFIVDENPFIPQGREPLYARGLLAGLQGDLVIAASLLIPQLENSLRHLLKQHGFIASKPDVIQDDYLLNKVLYSPDLKEVLTEDIIFIIKGLLVERMGANIRNEICHGLFDYSQFFQPQITYIWWLTLYLCLYAKLQAMDS
ncbi:MAG: DUF4209 domain-containing protein [Coleofasciculus sp. C1-SOL-03]|uniref:DUF4209 domain-containing protein n=1 Tax=Coleofasciculus sp. C1-SOL-03 TaxID=3069522 RepID=UPI0032FF576B